MIDICTRRTAARPWPGRRSGISPRRSVPCASGLTLRKRLGNASCAYYSYDAAGRLASLANRRSDNTVLTSFTYGRLAGGNVEKILREDGETAYYSYDLADRLIHENWRTSGGAPLYGFAYDYDAAGNRVKEDKDGVPTYYHYDAANELTRKEQGGDGAYFAYDENGSTLREHDQTADTTTYYAYNDNGLTSRVSQPDAGPTYFHYDARMQRFAVEFSGGGWGEGGWGTSGWGGGTGGPAYFVWDGMDQLEERAADLSLTALHTHGA
ncbi:MAG: RHS repeat domain-containing protein, partial [Planctomycetota bacterium]